MKTTHALFLGAALGLAMHYVTTANNRPQIAIYNNIILQNNADKWDRQMIKDAESGKPDGLLKAVSADYKAGKINFN